MSCRIQNNGFTLIELIVVLAIISAIATIIAPYASRTNNTLKIKEHALNIAETIKYAIDLAGNSQKSVILTIDTKNKSYRLKRAGDNGRLESIDGFYGMTRVLGNDTQISNLNGFSANGRYQTLLFDPAKQWPNASLSISNIDILEKIKINYKSVTIESSTYF